MSSNYLISCMLVNYSCSFNHSFGQILLEAFVVGISTVVMGSLVGFIMSKIVSTKSSTTSGKWNKYYIMELSLFFTGFFLHVVYEILVGFVNLFLS